MTLRTDYFNSELLKTTIDEGITEKLGGILADIRGLKSNGTKSYSKQYKSKATF